MPSPQGRDSQPWRPRGWGEESNGEVGMDGGARMGLGDPGGGTMRRVGSAVGEPRGILSREGRPYPGDSSFFFFGIYFFIRLHLVLLWHVGS